MTLAHDSPDPSPSEKPEPGPSSPTSGWYLVRADSPLVFFSGKPRGAAEGPADDGGLPLPWPGTLAGGVRAAWADATDYFSRCGGGHGDPAVHQALLGGLGVTGPLVGELADDGCVAPLAPVPRDALRHWRAFDGSAVWTALQPRPHGESALTSQPQGLLPLISTGEPDDAMDSAPPFWSWLRFIDWLADDRFDALEETAGYHRIGFARDLRTHHQRDEKRGIAAEQMLFQSPGLDGAPEDWDSSPDPRQRVLLSHVSGATARFDPAAIDGTVRRLGGEGRSPRYRRVADGDPTPSCGNGQPPGYVWEAGLRPDVCPPFIQERLGQLRKGDLIRLVLVTPAVFVDGSALPFLNHHGYGTLPGGTKVSLVAMTNDRWKPYAQHRMVALSKGVRGVQELRRVMPAGAVYWLRLEEMPSGDRLAAALWFKSVCVGQAALDGWGVAVVGLAPGATESLTTDAAAAAANQVQTVSHP